MLIRPIRDEEKQIYNQAVNHPLQTWEWGEFRKTTGQEIERIGFFKQGQLEHGLQISFHPIPHFDQYTVGYCPRGFEPNQDQLSALKQLGEKHNALFIKLEPNVVTPAETTGQLKPLAKFLVEQGCRPGRPLFTKHTFQLDLTQTEKELFANLDSKTRYNVRLARRKGVRIVEDTSRQGLETYLKILQETIDRQGFYAHNTDYFVRMWDHLESSGMMHIFQAVYDDTPLVSWIIFKLHDRAYYPYGASSNLHREVMASNLMMWEMITWSKAQGCGQFDMWGSLGPDAKKSHPWYGFHRFKKGYGGKLMRFVGTYDLVLKPTHYQLFRVADNLRWKGLRLQTKIKQLLNL